jgi:hypothetical protein
MTKLSTTTSTHIGQKARSAGYALAACALGFASATMAMPTAHADPLDSIRGAVNGARAQSTCPPLTYSSVLEADAQKYVRLDAFEEKPTGYDHTAAFRVKDDPTDKATSEAVGQANPSIHDCAFKDFGVGMVRDGGVNLSDVAIVLGRPAAPVQPPQQPQVPPDQHSPEPPPAAAPVTDAISLSFGKPKITLIPPSASITATVSNSSALPGKCTYDATPSNTHRDFDVQAHGSTPLTFTGLATGTTYHARVSCKDASGKQTQPIGSSSQDVTF